MIMETTSKIESINRKDIKLLSSEDFDSLYRAYTYSFFPLYIFKINGKMYHIKQNKIHNLINELIGQYVTEFFGGKKLNSKLYIDDKFSNYLITENFIKNSHHYTNLHSNIFPKINFDKDEILSIKDLDNFDYIKNNKYGEIVETNLKDLKQFKLDLKIMIVSDFIRKQSDRKFRNFMFEYKDNRVKLMPLYDYEYSFDLYKPKLINSFELTLKNESIVSYIRNDDTFQELFYRAMNLNLNTILERLQDEYPVSMNSLEMSKYISIVLVRQDDIKRYNLLK